MQQSELWSRVVLAGLVVGLPAIRDSSSPIDCSVFGYSGQCVECPGYPLQVSGANIDLYHYTDNWATPNPTGDAQIAAIGSAVNAVLPLFSTFSPPLNVNITLVPSLPDSDLGETNCVLPDCTYCTVRISQQTTPGRNLSLDLGETTAHELYHCVQNRNQGNDQVLAQTGWWIEGSAGYFANKFYPDTSASAWFKLYNPNKPLYSQTNDERAGLFFQFLSNHVWDDNDINGFVIQQIQASQLGGSEPTIMSNNADLQSLFPVFAQKFVELAITFPDGSLAQGNPSIPITTTDIPLNLTGDGQQQSTSVQVGSFATAMYTATLQPGITYSIQWTPSTQDGKTVLAYQTAASVSGSTWITIDPSTPAQVPVDCSSGATQYQFLFTSTTDIPVSNGQLTFLRQSSQACGCNDLGIPLDPCLSGNWVLNDGDLQTLMESKLSQLASVTISNLAVTGAATFELPQGNMGGMTYDNLTIDYDGSADGMMFHTTMDVTGNVSGDVTMQAARQFCWANAQGQGVAHTSTTLTALSQPYVFDVPLTESYASPAITINYTCSATSLEMVGYSNGQYSWAMSYTKNEVIHAKDIQIIHVFSYGRTIHRVMLITCVILLALWASSVLGKRPTQLL